MANYKMMDLALGAATVGAVGAAAQSDSAVLNGSQAQQAHAASETITGYETQIAVDTGLGMGEIEARAANNGIATQNTLNGGHLADKQQAMAYLAGVREEGIRQKAGKDADAAREANMKAAAARKMGPGNNV